MHSYLIIIYHIHVLNPTLYCINKDNYNNRIRTKIPLTSNSGEIT